MQYTDFGVLIGDLPRILISVYEGPTEPEVLPPRCKSGPDEGHPGKSPASSISKGYPWDTRPTVLLIRKNRHVKQRNECVCVMRR